MYGSSRIFRVDHAENDAPRFEELSGYGMVKMLGK
jgi:hypothetical protein